MNVSRRAFFGGTAAFAVAGCISQPSRKPIVRFGYVTGSLCGTSDAQTLRRLKVCASAFNEEGVDFMVEGGCFKAAASSTVDSLSALEGAESAFARFKGPRHHVLGDRDVKDLSKDEFFAHVANAGQTKASARSYYSFVRSHATFIVLDSCFRHDACPYERGNFADDDALLPADQRFFLSRTLAEARENVVVFIHHRLDAEEGRGVRNAARVRRILEKSGKVRLVVQGHGGGATGQFREVNGIGYYTAPALARAPSDAAARSLVEVHASGAVHVYVGSSKARLAAAEAMGDWKCDDLSWRSGHWQVHYVFTGRGESMFHVFPDGTSMLLDCGDSMRFHGTAKETPHLPDLSRRAGEWVARYVRRVNPKDDRVDVFHLSHYHEDHGGGFRWHGGPLGRSRLGAFNLSGVADAARFLTFGRVWDRAWPGFDDPIDVLANPSRMDGTPQQLRALYAHLADEKGTKIEKFRLGARQRFGELDVFNLCANGRYVRRDGTVRDLYAHLVKGGAKALNENGMSCGMIFTLGKFKYFTAGDFSDRIKDEQGRLVCTEDLLAEAVGPVDVAKLNHHGHHSMYPGLVRALRARVWTCCVLDQAHCTLDTMTRLADESLYAGPRTFLPTYMPYPFAGAAAAVVDEPCHVILDVPPGGAEYVVSCVSAARENGALKAQYGFESRGEAW